MKTVDEKKSYHGRGFPKGEFSQGYIIGVTIYRGYGKGGTPVNKEKRQKLIDDTKRKAMKGDLYSKGVMCAIRDCANERKANTIQGALRAAATPLKGPKKK